MVQFVWVNQEDDAEVRLIYMFSVCSFVEFCFIFCYCLRSRSFPFQETAMSNAWYEVLSVLHLMAMLLLSQANLLLLPRTSSDGYQPKVSEGKHFICDLCHIK